MPEAAHSTGTGTGKDTSADTSQQAINLKTGLTQRGRVTSALAKLCFKKIRILYA